MVNGLVKIFTGKQIVLYNRHRQTLPIANDPWNRKKFLFIQSLKLWRIIPFSSKSKMKFRIMYALLSIIRPTYILDVNWISSWHRLYYLWCRENQPSKFLVVQHGLYFGGIVEDLAHRYSVCQTMLCWSDYFKNTFATYNAGKNTTFVCFGNPVFNQFGKRKYSYRPVSGVNVLLLPSVMSESHVKELFTFKTTLERIGCVVHLKQHNLQKRLKGEICDFTLVNDNVYDLLESRRYDLVVADHSSSLIDAIFFCNHVLYFGPCHDGVIPKNLYSDFLPNLALHFESVDSREKLISFVDVQGQENLFNTIISLGENKLNFA